MLRTEKVQAVVCYEKTVNQKYPLLNDEMAYVYRIHYLEVERCNGRHRTLIDYRYEKELPYPHYSLESMLHDILAVLEIYHYRVQKWQDFGRTYYDILYVDISNPLHIEHFGFREE